MRGSDVVGEAAVRAGCRFYFGYPITPQNELPEFLSWRLLEVGGTFIQAESEVADEHHQIEPVLVGLAAHPLEQADADEIGRVDGEQRKEAKDQVEQLAQPRTHRPPLLAATTSRA